MSRSRRVRCLFSPLILVLRLPPSVRRSTCEQAGKSQVTSAEKLVISSLTSERPICATVSFSRRRCSNPPGTPRRSLGPSFLSFTPAHSGAFDSSSLSLTLGIRRVHYIPVQPALYNLPSIVAFLRAHDAVAAKIASNGKRFADDLLGERQRVLGVAGVLVEYARLWSKKRTEMAWELPPTSSP